MGKKILEVRPKPILIIVEGCDLSGKSTLVHELNRAYPGVLLKLTYRPRRNDKEEIRSFQRHVYSMLEYINNYRKSQTIILDRFFMSEVVYSKVKRGYEAFSDRSYSKMEKVISALPHLYVYCNPGEKEIIKRFHVRGDDHITENDVKPILSRYDRFFRQTIMNKLELDTTKPVPILLESIKAALEHYEHTRN